MSWRVSGILSLPGRLCCCWELPLCLMNYLDFTHSKPLQKCFLDWKCIWSPYRKGLWLHSDSPMWCWRASMVTVRTDFWTWWHIPSPYPFSLVTVRTDSQTCQHILSPYPASLECPFPGSLCPNPNPTHLFSTSQFLEVFILISLFFLPFLSSSKLGWGVWRGHIRVLSLIMSI